MMDCHFSNLTICSSARMRKAVSTTNEPQPSNSQETMRNLNLRLADFLQKIHDLQENNERLERQIFEWLEKATYQKHQDWSRAEGQMDEMRTEVHRARREYTVLCLKCDEAQMEAMHFKARYAVEMSRNQQLQDRISALRKMKKHLEQQNKVLEREVATKRTEIQDVKQIHKETVQALQHSAPPLPDVVVLQKDDGSGMELSQLLDEIRMHYESLITTSSSCHGAASQSSDITQLLEAEPCASLSKDNEALKAARAELKEVRRQWQSLQVEIESLHALEKSLVGSLQASEEQFRARLHDLSAVIQGLEMELLETREGIECQRQKHENLLNTKVRLEQEIATYRSLLEQEEKRIHRLSSPKPQVTSDPTESNSELTASCRKGSKKGKVLMRHRSLVLPGGSECEKTLAKKIETVASQEILQGNVVRESAEAHGTVETEKIDEAIREWECSFFKGNPHLKKKSVSLRFDLHLAVADEGCAEMKQDSLPDVEVRLVMKRSRSISNITPQSQLGF
ncbi:keratin-like protein KRT222 [Polypterus senegalus]|uniref:keratin-like protein KRT222 n=1 Tax=Polypterus senegalus TaxID=55291 RepID=UPI001965A856|nr:keratin-like protein KRT222 [Polypterus senegalus]